MCKGRVCFNLLITPVYFEIVFAIDSVCDVQFISLLNMVPINLKLLTICISSYIKVSLGIEQVFVTYVIQSFKFLMCLHLICVSQVTMRGSSVLMLCLITVMPILSVSCKVS